MDELNYLRRKCDAIEALKSRICKDLSKVEEIGRVRRGTFTLPSHGTVLDSLPSHGSSCLTHFC